MRFRPDDGYSKPACGDRHSTIGFLLRVRIKKNRVTQADTTEAIKSKCTDTTNLEATASCIIDSKENLKTTIKEDSCKDNVSIEDTVERRHTADNIKNFDGAHEESSPKSKKNVLSTFDNNKYENLSQKTDYELPCLKILGRVETEFKFTSMFNKLYKIFSV